MSHFGAQFAGLKPIKGSSFSSLSGRIEHDSIWLLKGRQWSCITSQKNNWSFKVSEMAFLLWTWSNCVWHSPRRTLWRVQRCPSERAIWFGSWAAFPLRWKPLNHQIGPLGMKLVEETGNWKITIVWDETIVAGICMQDSPQRVLRSC